MPRRKEPATAPAPSHGDPVPDWLPRFAYADWADETEQPPAWWRDGGGRAPPQGGAGIAPDATGPMPVTRGSPSVAAAPTGTGWCIRSAPANAVRGCSRPDVEGSTVRRRPPVVAVEATGAAVVLPAELTYQRMGSWDSSAEFHAARREWLRAHGIDPADQSAVMSVLRASQRAHAVVVRDLSAPDRLRRYTEGAGPDDAA